MRRRGGRRPGFAPGRARRKKAENENADQSAEIGEERVDIVEPDDPLPPVEMSDLPESLREGCSRAGWPELMPVQCKSIPYLLQGRDLMVQSRTGSGKTGGFLLPMLERLDPDSKHCQALVLTPTRELARQVAGEAERVFPDGLRSVAIYGGVGYGPQLDAFKAGTQLVVGTPGRILDHLLKKNFTLDRLRMLVFDEADRMLSMGFYPDMQRLAGFLPAEHVDSFMFSATIPPTVRSLAGEFLEEPGFLSLSRDKVHVEEIEHVFYDVPGMKRDRTLVRIIEMENPSSAIIFCNTKADVNYLSIVLKRFGYDADELSSDLGQAEREKVLQRVRDGELRFLVATDVASRGIDILELTHVFNYEPPQDPEDYIHRVGRTGRAGATGEAITLVSGIEKMSLTHIGKRYGIDLVERETPSEEEVAATVAERVTVLLEAKLRDRDKLRAERMRRFLPLVKRLGESEDESKLIAMLIDDYYQQSLHNPPEIPKGGFRGKGEGGQRKRGRGGKGGGGRKGGRGRGR